MKMTKEPPFEIDPVNKFNAITKNPEIEIETETEKKDENEKTEPNPSAS